MLYAPRLATSIRTGSYAENELGAGRGALEYYAAASGRRKDNVMFSDRLIKSLDSVIGWRC